MKTSIRFYNDHEVRAICDEENISNRMIIFAE
jgi:hypothetical protein